MRLALAGATLAVAAYATFTDVTYLRNDGYAAALPEHRRIDVRPLAECEAVVARADLTLGSLHAIMCEPVPRIRHWTNVMRDAIDRRRLADVALKAVGGEAAASAAPATLR